MKVKIFSPDWGHTWLDIYPKLLKERGHEVVEDNPDVVLNMWASPDALKLYPDARHIMFLRRYELFSFDWPKYDWNKIECLILVNDWIKKVVDEVFKREGIKTKTMVIYNAVDTSKWTYRERGHGKKIGMACHVHPKKNLPLALQILAALPDDYELHIAGKMQEQFTFHYIDNLARSIKRRVFIYDHIEHSLMDKWWEDKNYCLSTSISEGCPNNVLEAMAKGIKPIVHNWPVAEEQFRGFVFNEVDEAVQGIDSTLENLRHVEYEWPIDGDYNSALYHQTVNDNFSLDNYRRVLDVIDSPRT